MRRRTILRLLSGAAAALMAPGLASCVYTEAGYYGGYGYEYYYYPDVNVYFHVQSGYYYYPYGSKWRRARVLPGHIHLDRHQRQRIYAPDRHPYDRNQEHRRNYSVPEQRDRSREGQRQRQSQSGGDRRGEVGEPRRRDDRRWIETEEWRRRPWRRRPD